MPIKLSAFNIISVMTNTHHKKWTLASMLIDWIGVDCLVEYVAWTDIWEYIRRIFHGFGTV